MSIFFKAIPLTLLAAGAFGVTSAQDDSKMACCKPKDAPVMVQASMPQDKPMPAKLTKGVQKATIVINGGYKPGSVSVVAGKPVELTFKREEKAGCTGVLVIKDLKLKKEIAPGKSMTVKFTPKKAGTVGFECGMGMAKGKIIVKSGKTA